MMENETEGVEFTSHERALGCMHGGTVGDALGATVQPMTVMQIEAEYGPGGPEDYGDVTFSDYMGANTSVTQMTVFTLEGLIRTHFRYRLNRDVDIARIVHRSYLHWLHTQKEKVPRELINGELITEGFLYDFHLPNATCLKALRATAHGDPYGTIYDPISKSRDPAAVVRAAPVAFWPSEKPAEIFRIEAETGALTHGHRSGYLSTGTVAVIIHRILLGEPLPAALDIAIAELKRWPRHEEELDALHLAQHLGNTGRHAPEIMTNQLGNISSAEQALAIAIYATLNATGFLDGLSLAINHSGASHYTVLFAEISLAQSMVKDQ